MYGLGLSRGRKHSLRIDVEEANELSTISPLNSASSSTTLIDVEPFGPEYLYGRRRSSTSRKSFDGRKLSWSSALEPAPQQHIRRKWLLFLTAAFACVYYFRCRTARARRPIRAISDCNPFAQRGLLHANATSVDGNFFRPHDPTCRPSLLTRELRRAQPAQSLAWLQDRTVVLIGDSVERRHVQDFCELVHGKTESITARHQASPREYRDQRDEALKTSGDHSERMARPFVCLVERHNLMLVSLYHYGFSTPEEYGPDWFQRSQVYYAPFALEDRIRHILSPILRSYRRSAPDLVTFASSSLDAAQLQKEQDKRSGSPSALLDDDLLVRYAERLSASLVQLLDTDLFASANILWRTAHVPKGSSGISAQAVLALDGVAESVVEEVRTGVERGFWESSAAFFSLREREQAAARVRVDYSGRMLQGQTVHLDDELHPAMLPGGKVWSDILLYELKHAVVSR